MTDHVQSISNAAETRPRSRPSVFQGQPRNSQSAETVFGCVKDKDTFGCTETPDVDTSWLPAKQLQHFIADESIDHLRRVAGVPATVDRSASRTTATGGATVTSSGTNPSQRQRTQMMGKSQAVPDRVPPWATNESDRAANNARGPSRTTARSTTHVRRDFAEESRPTT